jgi:hypothetical protein
MTIKFLKNCQAPQQWTQTICSCCGPELMGYETEFFFQGQEEDPDVYDAKIDLTGLKYRVDYDIVEYP